MLVLQHIEKTGDKGIWIRTLKLGTRLQQQQLTKILKRLENRRLIKAVKSVAFKNRKMYMLFDLVPSKDVTGGPWYTEQELDQDFIDGIAQFVVRVLQRAPLTRVQLAQAIAKAGVAHVSLGPQEVQQILDILIYDGKVERAPEASAASAEASHELQVTGAGLPTHIADTVRYRLARSVSHHNYVSSIPCGVCPVRDFDSLYVTKGVATLKSCDELLPPAVPPEQPV